MKPKKLGGSQTAIGANDLDALVRRLQQLLSQKDPLPQKPALGARAGDGQKATRERARTHLNARCHRVDGVLLTQSHTQL